MSGSKEGKEAQLCSVLASQSSHGWSAEGPGAECAAGGVNKSLLFACFSAANSGSGLSRRHPCRWSGGDASGEKYLEKCFMEGSQSPFSKANTTALQDLGAGEDVRHGGESPHACAEH